MMIVRNILKSQVNSKNKDTIAYSMRRKRLEKFYPFFYKEIFDETGKERVSILDVGGAERFWCCADENFLEHVDITMTNLMTDQSKTPSLHMRSVIGDATNLRDFEDHSVDLVFSNSVIEHVGDFTNQKKMANEMLRVGKHVYLQTPNKFFPIEPHFLILFFQFRSRNKRIKLLMKRDHISKEKAAERIDDVNLLSYKDIRKLFPNVKIHRERFLGLTKSFYLFF